MTSLADAYRSDTAFTAAVLLAFGLFCATASLWIRLIS